MKKNKLYSAAEKAIKSSLHIKAGEQFLLVTDEQKLDIAKALAYWAKEVGAETTTYLMTESLRPIVKETSLFAEMIPNRLIIFPSNYYHAAYHPENGFYKDPRLTIAYWMKQT